MAHQTNQLIDLVKILDSFIEFLKPFRQLLNTHNVQFIVDNLWQNESYISAGLRTDLESYVAKCNEESIAVNLVKLYTLISTSSSTYHHLGELFRKLHDFDKTWHEKVITSGEVLISSDGLELKEFHENVDKKFQIMVKQNRFMNAKKVYEVDEMSKFVSKLCKKLNVHTVRDFVE